MGIFDKLKNIGKTEKAEQLEQEEQKSGEQQSGDCANDGRRFTYMVEDIFQLKDQQGIVVVGTIHGTICEGDAVYIMCPGNAITLTEVSGLELKPQGKVKEASNQPVAIWLKDIEDKSKIARFSVITSIRPQTVVDVDTAVENPYILGLAREYGRFYKEADYINLLVYQIAHGHYITPIYMNKEPETQENGKCVMGEGTTMGFLSLKHPQDAAKDVFPVFTDWEELRKWKNVFSKEHPPKTVILRFPDCVAFVLKNSGGMVLNPFGTAPVFLPIELIKDIVNTEGYQAEFGSKQSSNGKEVKVKKDTRVMVGIPSETKEVTLIKNALLTYAKHEEEVKRIDFLLKIEENNERAYLCVVDCSEEKGKKIFGEIHKAIQPFANEVKIIDFMTYKRAEFVRDILEKNPPVYQQ